MLESLHNEELLALLGTKDETFFFNQLNQYSSNKRLLELIHRHLSSEKLRSGAIMSKGVAAASIPIDMLWMLMSIGITANIFLLIGFGVFAICAMGILAAYAISSSFKERLAYEGKLLRKRFISHKKNQIVNMLSNRINQEIRNELEHWPRLVDSKANKDLILNSKVKALLAERLMRESPTLRAMGQAERVQARKSRGDFFVDPLFAFGFVSTFLGSFFWGVSQIVTAFGFVGVGAAMLSPIGIALAATVAISLGVYLAYQRYHYDKHLDTIKEETKRIDFQQEQRLIEYRADVRLLKGLSSIRAAGEKKPESSNSPSVPGWGQQKTFTDRQEVRGHSMWSSAIKHAEQAPTLHAPLPLENNDEAFLQGLALSIKH